jgi:hypothetical protein
VEPFLYIIGNSQGRYLVRDGRLEAMPYAGLVSNEWDGRTVEELMQALYDTRGANDRP